MIQTDVDGSNATIKAATEQQAGVMTADMVKALNKLIQAVPNLDQAPIALHAVNAPDPSLDLSLPAVVQPQTEILPPSSMDNVIARLTALEQRANNTQDYASLLNALTAFRDKVSDRITALEARVAKLETNDNQRGLPAPDMSGEVNQLRAEVQQLNSVANENSAFIELIKGMVDDPTPVLKPEGA
ncbi:MAG: hypothetical protein AAGB04_25100 [Pseudomonadota bacterium]